MKIERMDLYQIVLKLTGSIQPVGETYEDERRLQSAKELTHLVDLLLGDISRAATNHDRVEHSIKLIGEHCYGFLKEVDSVGYSD